MLYTLSNSHLLSSVYLDMTTDFTRDNRLVRYGQMLCICWKKAMGSFEVALLSSQKNTNYRIVTFHAGGATAVWKRIALAIMALPGVSLIYLATLFDKKFQEERAYKQKMIFSSEAFRSAILAFPRSPVALENSKSFKICQRLLSTTDEDETTVLAESFGLASKLETQENLKWIVKSLSEIAPQKFVNIILKTTTQSSPESFQLPQIASCNIPNSYSKLENLFFIVNHMMPYARELLLTQYPLEEVLQADLLKDTSHKSEIANHNFPFANENSSAQKKDYLKYKAFFNLANTKSEPSSAPLLNILWQYHSPFFKKIIWQIYTDLEKDAFYTLLEEMTVEARKVMYREHPGGIKNFISSFLEDLSRVFKFTKLFLEIDDNYSKKVNYEFINMCAANTGEELCYFLKMFTPQRRLNLYKFLSNDQKGNFILKLLEESLDECRVFVSEMVGTYCLCWCGNNLNLLESFEKVFEKSFRNTDDTILDSKVHIKKLEEIFVESIFLVNLNNDIFDLKNKISIFNSVVNYCFKSSRVFSQFLLKAWSVNNSLGSFLLRVVDSRMLKEPGCREKFEILLKDIKEAFSDRGEDIFIDLIYSILSVEKENEYYKINNLRFIRLILAIIIDNKYIREESNLIKIYNKVFSEDTPEVIKLLVLSKIPSKYLIIYFENLNASLEKNLLQDLPNFQRSIPFPIFEFYLNYLFLKENTFATIEKTQRELICSHFGITSINPVDTGLVATPATDTHYITSDYTIKLHYKKMLKVLIACPNLFITIAQHISKSEKEALEKILNEEIADRQKQMTKLVVSLSEDIKKYEDEPLAMHSAYNFFKKNYWLLTDETISLPCNVPEAFIPMLEKYRSIFKLRNMEMQKTRFEALKLKLKESLDFPSLQRLCADAIIKLYPQGLLPLEASDNAKEIAQNHYHMWSRGWHHKKNYKRQQIPLFSHLPNYS